MFFPQKSRLNSQVINLSVKQTRQRYTTRLISRSERGQFVGWETGGLPGLIELLKDLKSQDNQPQAASPSSSCQTISFPNVEMMQRSREDRQTQRDPLRKIKTVEKWLCWKVFYTCDQMCFSSHSTFLQSFFFFPAPSSHLAWLITVIWKRKKSKSSKKFNRQRWSQETDDPCFTQVLLQQCF